MNVLFYIEPHPIRNSFTEFYDVGDMFFPILRRFCKAGYINLAIYSNDHVLDRIAKKYSDASSYIKRPTLSEAEFMKGRFQQWGDTAIEEWVDLVNGQGAVTAHYSDTLERLHHSLDIDLIFIWSENGAVRNIGKKFGIPVVYGELGPTRAPFLSTMYFDTSGTNGNASFRHKANALLRKKDQPHPSCRSWLIWSDRAAWSDQASGVNSTSNKSIIDIAATYDPILQELLPTSPYVYIPLQLADDLNTLQHSNFKSPEAFLKQILPAVADAGYAAVIKGHPGAKNRPYNLRKELEALMYAEGSGLDIRVIDNSAPQAASLYTLGNASFTASINSSVSFESMLLGVPALALGAAAYDAAGWMQQEIKLTPASLRKEYVAQLDALTGVHMERIFTPSDVVKDTDYLLDVFLGATASAKGGISTASLAKDIDFTNYILIAGSLEPGFEPKYVIETPLDARRLPRDTEVTIQADRVSFASPGTPWEIYTLNRTDNFIGYIDRYSTEKNQQLLGGWALEKNSLVPPVLMIIMSGNKINSTLHMNQPRPDVKEAIFPQLANLACGFSLKANIEDLPNLSIILVDSKNNCHVIEKIENTLNIADREPKLTSLVAESKSLYSKILARKPSIKNWRQGQADVKN